MMNAPGGNAIRTMALLIAAGVAAGCQEPAVDDGDLATKQAQIDLFDHLDLSNPADNLKALIKTRASLDPTRDVVWYFEGKVYSWVKETNPFANPPARSNKTLFCIRGYNIAKAVPFTQTT